VDSGGGKVGQVTAPAALQTGGATPLINGGWFRYQWNVDVAAKTMSAYLTGLEASNSAVQNVKLAEIKWGANAPKFDFTGRFGITAGTGGGTDGVNVGQVVVIAPAVAPGPIPTAGQ
jgi:hypothetical protein